MFLVEKDILKGLTSGRNQLPRGRDTDGVLIFGDGQTNVYWLYCPCKGLCSPVGDLFLTTPGTKWLPMKAVKGLLRRETDRVFIDPGDLPDATPGQISVFSIWKTIFRNESPEEYSKYLGRGPWDRDDDQLFTFAEGVISMVRDNEKSRGCPQGLLGMLCVYNALTGQAFILFPATATATWAHCEDSESFAIWFPEEKLLNAERTNGKICLHKSDGARPTAEQVSAAGLLSMFAQAGPPGALTSPPREGAQAGHAAQ